MNNETVKRFDVVIKLRADNVYDLYLNNKWVVSGGSCDSVLEKLKEIIRFDFLSE